MQLVQYAILVNKNNQACNNEITFDVSDLANGIYFYDLKSNNFTEVKKMILLE